jgi:hypothetical protein
MKNEESAFFLGSHNPQNSFSEAVRSILSDFPETAMVKKYARFRQNKFPRFSSDVTYWYYDNTQTCFISIPNTASGSRHSHYPVPASLANMRLKTLLVVSTLSVIEMLEEVSRSGSGLISPL